MRSFYRSRGMGQIVANLHASIVVCVGYLAQDLGAGSREGVVRVELLPLVAQQLFQPAACASKVCHMLTLSLLWCAVSEPLIFVLL